MLVTRQSASGHSSRSLAETESNYANIDIERELQVMVFAAEQFHQYIFGGGGGSSDHQSSQASRDNPEKASPPGFTSYPADNVTATTL